MTRLLALLLVSALSGACAHTQKSSDLESLRPVVESYHQRVRWKDYRFVARYVVPERRQEFEKSVKERDDERDLDVTEYDIENVELLENGTRAIVTSRFSWTRLPSVKVEKDTATSEFVYRNGAWLLERQHGGPFDGALP